jgi:YidC/Oxa1 family membrane protein insertase
VSILQPFYNAVAWLVVHIHDMLAPIFGATSGASWALSIVLLTIFMRILLIPLFVKQIKSQRAMTALQPQIKALQAKYKNDKQKLNEEMMKLWKEAGVNPFMGCLPLLPQIPIFFALFHTLNSLRPTLLTKAVHPVACAALTATCTYQVASIPEIPAATAHSAAYAKIFGVPVAAAFNSSSQLLGALNASSASTKLLCAILTVFMVATTFLTQRQMLARNAANSDTPLGGQQKVLLYVLPLLFLLYGYRFPLGVLLYWLTTNVWSLGQQFIVLRRMDAARVVGTGLSPAAPAGPAPGIRPDRSVRPSIGAPGALPPDSPIPADRGDSPHGLSSPGPSPSQPVVGPVGPALPAGPSRPSSAAGRRPQQQRRRSRNKRRR